MITNYYSTFEMRAVAFDLVDDRTSYDSGRYIELLAEVCSTILEPLDCDCRAERILESLESGNHILVL